MKRGPTFFSSFGLVTTRLERLRLPLLVRAGVRVSDGVVIVLGFVSGVVAVGLVTAASVVEGSTSMVTGDICSDLTGSAGLEISLFVLTGLDAPYKYNIIPNKK